MAPDFIYRTNIQVFVLVVAILIISTVAFALSSDWQPGSVIANGVQNH
jgi:hypothetical protein